MNERPCNSRIHPAGQRQQHAAIANLFADRADRVVDEGAHRPLRLTAADVEDEVAQQRQAVLRMHHFGVELHTVPTALAAAHRGVRGVWRSRQRNKARRRLLDTIPMRHPDLGLLRKILEQLYISSMRERRTAVFARRGSHHATAQLNRHGVHPVTDAERWRG